MQQVKIIRDYFELGLKEAMLYLDNLPVLLNQPRSTVESLSAEAPQRYTGLPRERAEALQRGLHEHGGRVTLQPRVSFHLTQSRLVAQNPGLSAELFWLLSKSADLETLRSLAKNPAAPKDFLLHIARELPAEVLQNQALPLLIMEDLLFVEQLPTALQLYALRDPHTPRALVLCLLSWAPLRRYAAEDKLILPEWLVALAGDEEWTVRFWVAKNANTPEEALRRLSQDPHEKVQAEARQRLSR